MSVCCRARLAALCLSAVCLCACDPPGQAGQAAGGPAAARGAAAALDDTSWRRLPVDEQFRVTNRLLATLYKGVAVETFYDLSAGLLVSQRRDPAFALSTVREQLGTPLDEQTRIALDRDIIGDPDARAEDGTGAPLEPRFAFDHNRPRQMPLARIWHYPLSRDLFSQWMAWHLANTILFSPAEEIDSANITDVQNLFRRLDLALMGRQTIRQIVATHQRSVENWRRFRSPEDNTREMMEIYLGIFDNDAEVPRAAAACQDLYLTDERDGYKLAYTDFPNYEPQLVLGSYVTTCGEFYDLVASHPRLIPRIVSVLVDYFFAGRDSTERLALVASISEANPVYFDDIFLAILFSRAYLLDSERPASFEENFLGLAARLQWEAHRDTFIGMTSGRGRLARTDMAEMGWPSMSLKLGRLSGVPLDSLSFANYHKALRESLLLDAQRWEQSLALEKPDPPEPKPVEAPGEEAGSREIAAYRAELAAYESALAALDTAERAAYDSALDAYQSQLLRYRLLHELTVSELLDYLFLTVVQRRASAVERHQLTRIIEADGHLDESYGGAFVRDGHMDDAALIVFDYLSRLPETYYLLRSSAKG